MSDAAWVGSLRFVSGAEEKVTRVFDAPGGFVESLGGLGVSDAHVDSVVSRHVDRVSALSKE
jgi:elongator complex protein 2